MESLESFQEMQMMRYGLAVLVTCLFAASLYLTHYMAEALIAGMGGGKDVNVPMPWNMQLLVALDSLLFTYRFPLIGLVLAIAVGIAAVTGRTPDKS